jgi:hypothetical protein
LVDTNKNSKTPEEVRTFRPTIDHISGSAMIAKHFKNLIAISRNYTATDSSGQNRTVVYVDKTKYGPSGKFELDFDPMTLLFRTWSLEKHNTDNKLKAMDEILEEDVKLPLFEEKKVEEVIEEVAEEIVIAPPKVIRKLETPVKELEPEKMNNIPF